MAFTFSLAFLHIVEFPIKPGNSQMVGHLHG
jgi:hypothetical protein